MRTREREIWRQMIRACYHKNDPLYLCVGAHGARVHRRWKEDFDAFYEDMGPCPDGMVLRRKRADRGFEPNNCYWGH